MEFKFYKTTSNEFIGKLQAIREARKAHLDHIQTIADEVGAYEWRRYEDGSVACFCFRSEPDRAVWKLSHDGYMPKKGCKAGKELRKRMSELSPGGEFKDVLCEYKFPMMVLGEATNQGVRVHNSALTGNFDKGSFFVKVPKENGCKFTPPDFFTEVKEWEMLKLMDE